jgi:hypothetical protein
MWTAATGGTSEFVFSTVRALCRTGGCAMRSCPAPECQGVINRPRSFFIINRDKKVWKNKDCFVQLTAWALPCY